MSEPLMETVSIAHDVGGIDALRSLRHAFEAESTPATVTVQDVLYVLSGLEERIKEQADVDLTPYLREVDE
jgi:hypothetical protein